MVRGITADELAEEERMVTHCDDRRIIQAANRKGRRYRRKVQNPARSGAGELSRRVEALASRRVIFMIDDDTLKHLLRINDDLFQVCKRLNEKREVEISWQLIPLVNELTHILVDEGSNRLQ